VCYVCVNVCVGTLLTGCEGECLWTKSVFVFVFVCVCVCVCVCEFFFLMPCAGECLKCLNVFGDSLMRRHACV
jgi:hypothetical protein